MDVKMEGENDESIQSKLLDFTMKEVGTFTQDDFDHVLRYISAFSSRNTFNLASQVIEKVPLFISVVFPITYVLFYMDLSVDYYVS